MQVAARGVGVIGKGCPCTVTRCPLVEARGEAAPSPAVPALTLRSLQAPQPHAHARPAERSGEAASCEKP